METGADEWLLGLGEVGLGVVAKESRLISFKVMKMF